MKISVTIAIILVGLSTACLAAAGKELTNSAVIKMVNAGLDPEVIVQTVESNQEDFDLSMDGLVSLKKAGVPTVVTKAMIARSAGQSGISEGPASTSLSSGADNVGGVFVLGKSEKTRLKYATTTVRANTVFLGLGGMKTSLVFEGAQASYRLPDSSPRLQISLPVDANVNDTVSLVKLQKSKDKRFFPIGRVTAWAGTASGVHVPAKFIVPVDVAEGKVETHNSHTVFIVSPKVRLDPGEYAIGISNVYYDFGVDLR